MTYFMWFNDLVELTWEGDRPVNYKCWCLFEGIKAGLTNAQKGFVWHLGLKKEENK